MLTWPLDSARGERGVAVPINPPSPIEDVWIWKSPGALPRGFFVPGVRVGTDEEALAALDAPAQLTREVVVDQGEPMQAGAPCDSPVATREVRADRVEQRLTACAPGAVVLADAWYPGWSVEVDGVSAQALRAWGFVRAVRVSAGPHTIAWRFEPWSFRLGAALSILALFAVVASLARRRVHGADPIADSLAGGGRTGA